MSRYNRRQKSIELLDLMETIPRVGCDGAVCIIAELWLNDKKVGTRWTPPFTFDLSDELKEGSNKLEVKVTNTWRNQLIFDNNRPADKKKTWTTNPPEKSESDLNVFGLIGPVTIKTIDTLN